MQIAALGVSWRRDRIAPIDGVETTMAADYEDHSEFNGGGVQPNSLFPKTLENMSIAERLRLQSITGQDTDPKALPDPAFWRGAQVEDPLEVRARLQAQAQADRQRVRAERDRYNRRKP